LPALTGKGQFERPLEQAVRRVAELVLSEGQTPVGHSRIQSDSRSSKSCHSLLSDTAEVLDIHERFREPDFQPALGQELILPLVRVVILNHLQDVGIRVRQRTPEHTRHVDAEGRVPHERHVRVVEERVNLEVGAACIRLDLVEEHVETLVAFIPHRGDLNLTTIVGRNLVVEARATDPQLTVVRGHGLLERTGVEFVPISAGDGRARELNHTLARVSPPVGLGRDVRQAVVRADLVVIEEPAETTGHALGNDLPGGWVGDSRLATTTEERIPLETGKVINAVGFKRVSVGTSLVVLERFLHRSTSQLESRLVNLRVVRDFVREKDATRLRARTFSECRTRADDELTDVRGSGVEHSRKQELSDAELDVIGALGIDRGHNAGEITSAGRQVKTKDHDVLLHLEVRRIGDIHTKDLTRRSRNRSAGGGGGSGQVEHDGGRWSAERGRLDTHVAFLFPFEFGMRREVHFREGKQTGDRRWAVRVIIEDTPTVVLRPVVVNCF